MHIILAILGGLAGLVGAGSFGALLGAVIGILIAEVLAQRRRIAALEKIAGTPQSILSSEVVFTPVADAAVPEREAQTGATSPQRPPQSENHTAPMEGSPSGYQPKTAEIQSTTPFDSFFAGLGTGVTRISSLLSSFFTGGNLVLKIGVVILFFGVAFLLKYAAQRNLVPLEFRLAGVAAGGLVLLAAGWQLRRRVLGYGLILQGGGIGILYLVIYAAARLYHFLPLTLSLAVMIALVVLSSFLAILQESKSLAMAGIVGGFLAPVLMSTGEGSHVLLFSYYALLNIGILAIAWFKSWRELNLLGFFFTFAIATLWGASAYQPRYFSSTEPFLVFFFLLYVVVSVLFAHRQPLNLKGFIDGPLVFGLPLVATSLQYCLVQDYRYGMALSVLALGLFYAVLATLLWRRLQEGMRMLTEAFLAMAIVFGSLTIPLALDGQWTSAVWALEGAAMIWVGVRQERFAARIFALLLQVGAAIGFLDAGWYPFGASVFLNRFFLGCVLISLAALFSSWYLEKFRSRLRRWEGFLPLPLMIWGLLWWFMAGWNEADRHFAEEEFVNILLLYLCCSTMVMTMVARRIDWRQLILSQLIFLPAVALAAPLSILAQQSHWHLFAGWGWLAWPVALFTIYRLLFLVEDQWPQRYARIWHITAMCLVLFVLSQEVAWLANKFIDPSLTWQAVCWGLVPASAVYILLRWGGGLRWPIGKFPDEYLGAGCAVIALLLLFWHLWCLGLTGNPVLIGYLPLINPLEMSQIFTLIVLFFWNRERGQREVLRPAGFLAMPVSAGNVLLGIAGFLLLNATAARTVHFFGGIPYTSWDLYHSVIFQSALAALWGAMALVITVWSARSGSRRVWCVGALLLAMVVVKLFAVDLSGTGTVARIISFLVVGILMLIIGYFSPLPPKDLGEKQ